MKRRNNTSLAILVIGFSTMITSCSSKATTNEGTAAGATCDDGVLEAGETCDPAASCPAGCDDGNVCTLDQLTGSAQTCNVACISTPITTCAAGDGCCPAGCSATNDADCSATCGNGIVDATETCDPISSCPTTCDDGIACTQDQQTGSTANCNVACSNTPITACISGDGCCAPGCNSTTDSDCTGGGTGGAGTGGMATGGVATGGTATGGMATGGAATGGVATGGVGAGGTATGGAATGGSSTEGPCDIYAAASTPCVAAYSMVRSLSGTYSGPLYQLRRGGTMQTDGSGVNQKTGVRSGGTTQDIGLVDGFADSAAHDAFCGNETCTVSVLYDQSGKGNDLQVAPAGCYDDGSSNLDDFESDANRRSLTVSGHRVYALSTDTREGYRNNNPTDFPRDDAAQGIYMVADGTNYGSACCWDFGNASQDNCYGRTGIMSALFLGTGYWGRGTGSGPWFMADFEGGVWAGGSGQSSATNNSLPSSNMDYAFGILKNTTTNYAIRVGNAQSGGLTTAYDGQTPKTLLLNGAIILGIGGDNSNHSKGTFYEGVVTAGRPDDAADDAVFANVQAAGYGQ